MRQTMELIDRINRVINTDAFQKSLNEDGLDIFEFQCRWSKESRWDFNQLSEPFKKAILAGEIELLKQS